jgi:IS5 family transposase
VGGAVPADRAGLSQAGQWPPAGLGSSGCCGLFSAAMVQPVGPEVEEALYDSLAMRRFVGIDLGREPVPDETTACRFRHLLEEHDLGRRLFDEVQRHLAENGLKIATGTIVDATIINAPSSTKNAEKARDPEMHQTKKGNQWYFGMKAHFDGSPRGGRNPGQRRRHHGAARIVARQRDRRGATRPTAASAPPLS